MTALNLLAVLSLVLATYLAALNMALMSLSRLALERRLEERGLAHAATWLAPQLDSAVSITALLRTAFRLMFFAVILIDIVGLGEAARMTLGDVAIAGGISVFVLWIFTSVMGNALARYAATGLIVRSLPALRVLVVLGRPLKFVIDLIDEAIKRLTGANLNQEDEAEAQLLRSIEETHLQGALDEGAATLLENVVEFGSTDVGEVMTPRTDIDGIELTDDLPAIRQLIIEAGHSRIPVYRENLDDIVGILIVKDLVPYLGEKVPPDFKLEPLLRKPIVVPETKPVRELLNDFQKSEVHMAIVIDEYGGTAGLVTIEDVLEEIVGEIHDEHEPGEDDEPTLVKIGADRAEVDGRYRIDDLNEELDLELPDDEEYDTVAGFMLAELGRVPSTGESFESYGARFTALSATATHIQKIGIELLEPAAVNGREDAASGK
ncbi:MAG TPA: hemolysin family protein [Phycisphaerales bacterium]|nr:hemolysin family protein [Phycisphaerales bacterium]HRQ75085.1 hemolysin family protein [Phycisphaerales bacterium]